MNGQTKSPHFEPRWSVALAILAVIFLLALLPDRIRLLPIWATYVVGFGVLIPIGAVGLTTEKARWLRVERTVTLLFFVVAGAVTLGNLANLIGAMVYRSREISGLELLTSSIAVWVTNVLMFSMLYWQIDRGGPEARVNDASTRPDWLFPQEGAPAEDVPHGWHPTFIDYLYLGYSTATAFSTTDAMPLTARAKLLMMLESTISLMTIVIVASRAINILGN
jgi:uncharacterized membrane protein